MATWKISTREKKSCVEQEYWVKDSKTIVRITGFRWGTFTVETSDDNPPEGIREDNEDSIEMYSYFGDNAEDGAELDMLDDGWYADWEFPEDMDAEERQRIIDGFDEDSYDFLEGEGWYNDETECWLSGPLDIERVN